MRQQHVEVGADEDRKSTRLNSSHQIISYAVFCLKKKQHTSFASLFVYHEVDDAIRIEINTADLRIDTFRVSGAGGQHVNKTDSASRFFFLNDTAATEIYTLSLHDALPISDLLDQVGPVGPRQAEEAEELLERLHRRSEEHTSELQSPDHLVCRLLLEK